MSRKIEVTIVGNSASLERSFGAASRSARGFNAELSKVGRGALAGSGVFRGLGRSIAFASGGFLAFASAGEFIRKSIDAAKEAQVTQQQLGTQIRDNGKSFAAYRGEIDRTNLKLSGLSGFTKDELDQSLTTILRTTDNVSKALRDNATAADLARARHIGLAQAALVIAKVEGGNTTLLRRQGFEIRKHATAEEALAFVRARIAGQARAGTTEQERFGAVLHDTQVIIGAGILPVLNKYLASAASWLTQMNESGQLQKEVNRDFAAATKVIGGVVGVVEAADRVTGSFKNTLELLAGLKIASKTIAIADSIGLIGTKAKTAEGKVALLRGSLLRLGAIGAIAIGIDIVLNRKAIDEKVSKFLDSHGLGFLDGGNVNLPSGATSKQIKAAANRLEKQGADPLLLAALRKAAAKVAKIQANAAKPTPDRGFREADLSAPKVTPRRATFTAQGNKFFDNSIARILERGGLGSIQQQVAALRKANGLIAARLKATKDVTRRLNLEDELLQNAFQIKSLQESGAKDAVQGAQDALQKRQDAVTEFIARLQLGVTKAQATIGLSDDIARLKDLQAGIKAEIKEFGNTADLAGQLFDVQQQLTQARTEKITSRQFRQLGLTATGDTITPGVPNLRKRIEQITGNLSASTLNTPKLRAELARFSKVLSEGLVPKDVRAKIKELLDGIADDLKGHTKNLTAFRHVSSTTFVDALGLNLTAAQKKRLQAAITTLGPGNTIPSTRSAAFAGAGGYTINGGVHIHGVQNVRQLEEQLTRRNKQRPGTRSGPYTGRH